MTTRNRKSARLGGAFAAAIALTLAFALATGGPDARAQDPAAAAGCPILVVDMNRIQRDSAVGRSVREQVEGFRKKMRDKYESARAGLRRDEAELTRLRQTLPRAEFDARVSKFEARVRDFKRDQAADNAKINQFLATANEIVRKRIEPILQKLMRERGAPVILHRHSVVAAVNALDVTEEAIALLDAEELAVTLEIDG